MKALDRIAVLLMVIGCLDWGMVGLADFNAIMWVFIAMPRIQHLLYLLFGLAALWTIGRCLSRRFYCS
jgi:uncharacterized membrane protein YuzA (DUF378 family)